MNQSGIENLKAKLVRRANQIREANYLTLASQVEIFCKFIETEPIYKALLADLKRKYPDDIKIYEEIRSKSPKVTLMTYQGGMNPALGNKNDQHLASLAHSFLKIFQSKWTKDEVSEANRIEVVSYAPKARHSTSMKEIIHFFYNIYVEPIVRYLEESLDNTYLNLHLLTRYKKRSEWFFRETLWALTEKYTEAPEEAENLAPSFEDIAPTYSQREKRLAQSLYAFLADEGLEFQVEPESPRGRIDLLAGNMGIEVKVFSSGTDNIKKGIAQLYKYMVQHNLAVGYLAVFNISPEHLNFLDTKSEQGVSFIPLLHKTIFFIDFHIHPNRESMSTSELKIVNIPVKSLLPPLE